jgi:hypothetical protein
MGDSMDQGFNDQELADIMSEIDDEIESSTHDVVQEQPKMHVMEEVSPKVTPIKPEVHHVSHKPSPVVESPKPHSTSMSFSVEGDMKLNLKFWVNGQEIGLSLEQSEGLVIELAGGAVFKVPLVHKKVA